MTMLAFAQELFIVAVVVLAIVGTGFFALLLKCYKKVSQGQALIRNGVGGTQVSFSGKFVIPIMHRVEYMDVSVKRIEIDRRAVQGLVCKDNLRADIVVAFFVRVNNTVEDVIKVAQSLGCERASDRQALVELFDAKFSEALKTVGKQFDFVELYTDRVRFREQILEVIGTDLSGYVLEDAAIDYLEQTDKKLLNPDNILDAEGIKKITVLTAEQYELANDREREKDKTITQQNVEADEAILELNKQLAEADAKQKREIASIQAREEAETKRVQEAEREKAEKARISAEEEIFVAEQNKQRQVIVATRNKERTDAIELERVERDRGLEATERERVVSIAQVDKEKAVEAEKKELQAVIRERVMVEKTVVTEEEKIKDTREFATAERHKSVQITKAEEEAEQALVKDIKAAEAAKKAEEFYAEQKLIDADANLKAAEKNAAAKKSLALASVKEHAVAGTAEAEVMEAKAVALEKEGTAEAKVLELKYHADADGIRDKAEAMKIFDAVGKEHEEFKLRLNKDLEIELAEINIRKEIAAEQAKIVAEALKAANIEIIGGENQFFERLVNAITTGKSVDRAVNNSGVLTDLKESLIGSDEQTTAQQIRRFVSQFGLKSEDIKNLTISALVAKLIAKSDKENKGVLSNLLSTVKDLGMANKPVKELGL
ncbi:MAG: Band 7 family protein [Phycisphaerae bacterium SG8_4]|nr:MAG: Band 7 family protein [Phycisphaerae bacterium SG8_4]